MKDIESLVNNNISRLIKDYKQNRYDKYSIDNNDRRNWFKMISLVWKIMITHYLMI